MLDEGLRSIPFLRDLPPSAVQAVAERLERRSLAEGEVLFHGGDPSDAVFLVESGRLEVLDPASGLSLAAVGAGGVVGETGLLLDSPRTATVRVDAPAELWRLGRADLDELVQAFPAIGLALGREVSRHLLTADERLRARPPRVIVVSPTGAAGLADAIAAEGVDPVAVLSLDGGSRTVADLPAGVSVLPPSLADPDAFAAFVAAPADGVSVVAVALPEEPTVAARAAVALAAHGVDLVDPLPGWAVPGVDPLRHLRAPRTPAELRRLARWVSGRAVGLALSSGGSKTIAHIGVIKVLREAGVPIDAVAGTSGGSVAAAGLALDLSHDDIVTRIRELPDAFKYRRLGPRVPPRDGLFSGAGLLAMFERWYGSGDIADAGIPLFVVAADINDGSEVVLRRGPVARAVRASMGIPGVFTPTQWEGRWLTDGGIVTPLPTRVLRDAGLGVVLASNVAGQEPPQAPGSEAPGIVETLGRIVASMERQVLAPQVALADVTARPIVQAANSFDFRHLDEYLEEGERAGREVLASVESLVKTQ